MDCKKRTPHYVTRQLESAFHLFWASVVFLIGGSLTLPLLHLAKVLKRMQAGNSAQKGLQKGVCKASMSFETTLTFILQQASHWTFKRTHTAVLRCWGFSEGVVVVGGRRRAVGTNTLSLEIILMAHFGDKRTKEGSSAGLHILQAMSDGFRLSFQQFPTASHFSSSSEV